MGKLRRIWNFILHIEAISSIFGWLSSIGLLVWLLSTVGALMTAFFLWLKGWDSAWWALAGFALFVLSLTAFVQAALYQDRKKAKQEQDKQPEKPESIDVVESLPRNNPSAERISGLASIEQALALSDITEVGTWTPSLSYVEKDGDTVLDLIKADGRYKSLERYLEIDCRLEFILPNLPDSTKISITGLPFNINSDIHGIPIECKSRDTPNRTATFSGHVCGGSAQVRFHVTPHDLISGEVCYLQFKIVHINDYLNGFR